MADGSTRGAVLVTGASTGIGRACAEHLDGLGFGVFAGVRKEADADSLRGAGSARMQPLMLDVTDTASVLATARAIEEAAPAGLRGLVNNAGIAIGGPLEFVTLGDWRRQLEVNFIGQIAVIQATLPALRRARGRIVNVTSIGGRVATPFLSPYSASKFALEAVTDALRLELLRFGIEVSAVEPGAVATPMWDKGRASAEEVSTSLPAEGIALYGTAIQAMSKGIDRLVSGAVPPLDVATAVEHALTAHRPRTRYVVGREARIRLLLARLLPTRAMDKLTVRVMGI